MLGAVCFAPGGRWAGGRCALCAVRCAIVCGSGPGCDSSAGHVTSYLVGRYGRRVGTGRGTNHEGDLPGGEDQFLCHGHRVLFAILFFVFLGINQVKKDPEKMLDPSEEAAASRSHRCRWGVGGKGTGIKQLFTIAFT